ncbi:MAG: S-methyl-5'-thioadenosine phosphorylase [Euryarchaeota archaeon]|nr:S-methyl-5'-thioadenosine phosphorylase [Euryarchaeota archaeon]
MERIAIIGGTGIYDPELFGEREKRVLTTPYGRASPAFIGELAGRSVVFMPRHGTGHERPPHRVNYRANIYALKQLGVGRIIATNSVGGINPELSPGDLVVPHDFIDFTRTRRVTFYDTQAVHVDMSQPYCPELREALIRAGRGAGGVKERGVYAATEGPRFETPAEIRMLSMLGCDIVGMTGIPEAVLARELEICYASIATVTNYAAGTKQEKLTATEVVEVVRRNEERLRRLIQEAVGLIPEERNCPCATALEEARV